MTVIVEAIAMGCQGRVICCYEHCCCLNVGQGDSTEHNIVARS